MKEKGIELDCEVPVGFWGFQMYDVSFGEALGEAFAETVNVQSELSATFPRESVTLT